MTLVCPWQWLVVVSLKAQGGFSWVGYFPAPTVLYKPQAWSAGVMRPLIYMTQSINNSANIYCAGFRRQYCTVIQSTGRGRLEPQPSLFLPLSGFSSPEWQYPWHKIGGRMGVWLWVIKDPNTGLLLPSIRTEKPCLEELLSEGWNLNRKEKESLLGKRDELKYRLTGRNEPSAWGTVKGDWWNLNVGLFLDVGDHVRW